MLFHFSHPLLIISGGGVNKLKNRQPKQQEGREEERQASVGWFRRINLSLCLHLHKLWTVSICSYWRMDSFYQKPKLKWKMESDRLLELRSVSFVLKPNQTRPTRTASLSTFRLHIAGGRWGLGNQQDLITVDKYPIHFRWLRTWLWVHWGWKTICVPFSPLYFCPGWVRDLHSRTYETFR